MIWVWILISNLNLSGKSYETLFTQNTTITHLHDHDQIVPNVTLQAPNFDQNQTETSEEESYHGSYMSVTLLLVGRSQNKKSVEVEFHFVGLKNKSREFQ